MCAARSVTETETHTHTRAQLQFTARDGQC